MSQGGAGGGALPTGTGGGAAPDAGGAPGQGEGRGQRQGMLAVNDLNYVLAPDLSVAVNTTFKNHFFQSANYLNTQRAICLFNSGADYGDMRSSTLNFIIELTGPAGVNGYFGKNGSILNVIRSITVSSRSGDELSRTIDLNHLSAMQNGFRYSSNWMETVGQTIGVGEGVLASDHSTQNQQQFCIPLYLLSDFFAYGRMMPAMVLGGLRLEIEWETAATCFQAIDAISNNAATVPVAGYTIVNPFVAMRSVQLTDGVQRALNEMSAVNGLEIVYCDYERTEQSLGQTTSLHLEVRKAASRALKATLSTRPTPDITDGLKDSFRSENFLYNQWQWQLGSLYFPQQPVKALNSEPHLIIPESYQRTLVTYGTYKGDQSRTSAVPLRNTGNWLDGNFASSVVSSSGGYLTTADATATNLLTYTPPGGGAVAESFVSVGDHIDLSGSVYTVIDVTVNAITVSPEIVAEVATELDVAGFPAYAQINWTILSHNNNPGVLTVSGKTPWYQHANIRADVGPNIDGHEGTFSNGRTSISCLLERSDLFNLTGVPINNSRVLSAQAQYSISDDARTATIFLKYVRLARVFLNNVEVEQ